MTKQKPKNTRKISTSSLRNGLDEIFDLLSTPKISFARRLRKKLNTYKKAKFNWFKYAKSIAISTRKSAPAEIMFLFDLFKRCGLKNRNCGFEKEFCLKKAKRNLKARKNTQKIATPSRFRKVITDLATKEEWNFIIFIYLCLLSGRRGVDVLRTKKKDILKVDSQKYSICSEYDKCGTGRSFIVDFEELDTVWITDKMEKSKIIENLQKIMKSRSGNENMFNFSLHNLSRKLKLFNLHSLRRIKVIDLIHRKIPIETIKSRMAWTTPQSFNRYKILGCEAIESFDTVEAVIEKIIEMGACR